MGLRKRLAAKFGKTEHEAGRWILLPMIITSILIYYKIYNIALYSSIITITIWTIYITSHTLEKIFYGKKPR